MAAAREAVLGAAEAGAKLVVLPECFAYLGPESGKFMVAEDVTAPGPLLSECLDWARRGGIELVLGGFWEKGAMPGMVKNACLVVNRAGEVTASYRKIHLFDVDLADGTAVRESETVEPGSDLVVAQTVAGPMGLSVCYDVRFPELYRGLVDAGGGVPCCSRGVHGTYGP